MSHEFKTGIRFNDHLGTLETASFLGEGVGAALYIVAIATGQLPLAALGIFFVVAAVVVLRAHLGVPQRSWRAPRRVATSWVSRGVVMMSGFLGFSILSVAAAFIAFLAPLQTALTMMALVLSVPVIVYAGMLLRSMRAIRLWRGAFLPLSFTAHSLASALTIAWALAPWLTADITHIAWLQPAAAASLMLSAAMSVTHLLQAENSAGVQASINRLLAGDLRPTFFWGAGLLGIVVPLAGLSAPWIWSESLGRDAAMAIFAVAAACRLYGDFAYRYAMVRAGAYEPVMPQGPFAASR